jgi:hypothetical protein
MHGLFVTKFMESIKLLPNQMKRQPKIGNEFFPITVKVRGRVNI